MSLATLQHEFMGHVLDENRPLPASWADRMRAGLDVYRNAYRTRLVDALRETFEQTAKWIGEESFRAAAAHYLISAPPGGWTLDLVGDGFAEILEALFANDPDVADLAWLEWAMHCAFTGADDPPLDAAGFAAASSRFAEDDWAEMTLRFVPTLQVRRVRTDCGSLWRALKNGTVPTTESIEAQRALCVVWREDQSPVFRLFNWQEGRCLEAMFDGAAFGSICADLAVGGEDTSAAASAGEMLLVWLRLGLIGSIRCEEAPNQSPDGGQAAAADAATFLEPVRGEWAIPSRADTPLPLIRISL